MSIGTKYKIFLLLIFFLSLPSFSFSQSNNSAVNVKFVVLLKNSFKPEEVFLSGNNNALGNWEARSVLMEKKSDSVWTKTLDFIEGEKIEFKINGGNWWTEAVDSNSNKYNNFQLITEKDTTIYINVYGWLNKMVNGLPVLTDQRFLPERTALIIDELWRYHPGDNTDWAKEDFNDSNWVITDSYLRWKNPGDPEWKNIGWFRFHFYADTAMWNKTLAMLVEQFGASEIYYNGRHLYSFGKIGNSVSTTVPVQNRIWKEFRIDPKYKQLLVVRYSNYEVENQKALGFSPGFAIYIKNLNSILTGTRHDTRDISINQMVFTLIPVILFFLHLFLYAFYPKQRENLFYAICLLGFAGITYFGYQKFISTNPDTIIWNYRLNGISVPVAIFFGLLTAYSIAYAKLPKRALIFFVIFIVMLILNLFIVISWVSSLNYIFFGITLIDLLYLSFRKSEKKQGQKKSWIITVGFFMLGIAVIYQVLIDYAVTAPPVQSGQVFVYGMLGLIISMSIYLSYNFSSINKDLERQLVKVKELSEKTIEQERIANKLELERRIIEVEHKRKTKELEEARELQLSLLPKNIPAFQDYEIVPFMKTATEVGGDYYDVLPVKNEKLTLAIGDATGHGVKAGTLVAVIKGLFQELDDTVPLNKALERIHFTLRSMHFHNLYMGLTLLRLDRNYITVSSAGMPPVLIYKKETGMVEELRIRHLPLPVSRSWCPARCLEFITP